MTDDNTNGANGNGNGITGDWKSVIVQTFVKSGPWALLLALVLGAIWYELDKWMGAYIRSQDRYILASTENIVTLQRATQVLTETVMRNTLSFADVADNVKHNQEMINSQMKLMERANSIMQDSPERSKRTLAVLERIEKLLSLLESGSSNIKDLQTSGRSN